MIKIQSISGIIKKISESNDEVLILKYENIMASMFGSNVFLLGSLVSFVTRYFVLHESINKCLIDSLFLFAFSVLFRLNSKIIKNEKIKSHIISVLFSAVLVFLVIRLYYLIGTTVWTVSIIFIMISMLRIKRSMLIILAVTIFSLGMYVWYKSDSFHMGTIYYISQTIAFAVLFIITGYVHKIIINRFKKIYEQYQYIFTSEEKLYLTLRSVGDGVIAVDSKSRVNFMNPIAEQLTGWNQEEAYGKSFETVFKIINEYSREKIESPIQKVFEIEDTVELANHTILISKDGSERAIEDTAAPIKDRFGKIMGVVLVFRDFSDKKAKRRQIEYLSYHDQLTGLYNRRFFEEELKRLDTRSNLPLSIIFADVNGLKTINDAFGHQYGDQLIEQVANVLKNECSLEDKISRTGGDEFIILLPKTNADNAQKLVKEFKEKIKQKKIMNINISVSFGRDTKNMENQSIGNVLKNAEDNMYKKKFLYSSSKRSAVIKSILNTLHIKSPREEAHSKRVSIICENIGKAYNLSDDDLKELRIAGELHDIGKIAIDEVILNKPGKLTEVEWRQIHLHSETGYRLLGTSSEYYNIAEYVLSHHERWDGKGYPKGLKGNNIPWKSRIISIADTYDAMTRDRPYRKAISKEDAVVEIKKNAGTQFDPDITRVFVERVLGFSW
ncbi:MAG: HD domain-containing phosphohydrolase [Eubacteriaceae bacterium]